MLRFGLPVLFVSVGDMSTMSGRQVGDILLNRPIFLLTKNCVGESYYPLHASPTPPQTTKSGASKKIRIKRGSRFQPINHRTRPISCGGLNQREPPVLWGSPSPRASADILFSPTSRAPEEQRQSRRIHSGGKLGGKRGIGGIGRYIQPSGACSASPLDQTCRRATGTSWISSLLLRGMVPR
jgi:hypothetical protein